MFVYVVQQKCKCGSQVCRGIIGGRTKAKVVDKAQLKGKGKLLKDKRKSKLKPDKNGEVSQVGIT